MWNIKKNDTNELIYKTERESQTQKTNLWLPNRKEVKDKLGDWDKHMHTTIYKIDNQTFSYCITQETILNIL